MSSKLVQPLPPATELAAIAGLAKVHQQGIFGATALQPGSMFVDGKSDGRPTLLQALADAVRQGRSEDFVAVNPHADPEYDKRVRAMVAASGRSDDFLVLNFDSSEPQKPA